MICRITGAEFQVSDAERQVIEMVSSANPLFKEMLPLPDTAPLEFLRLASSWGNLLNIFKAKSAYSGKPQLSRYNPELGYKMCTPEEFWSEEIDNREFGRPYDFSRPFFDQFDELLKSVYLIPLNATNCDGSDYVNGAVGVKNSYLCFGIFNSEDCLYSYMLHHCADCVDCIDAVKCNFCYDCHTVRNCYECRHCRICTECRDCLFCEDCIGCSNCVFSCGLRNAEYCIENRLVDKTEYENFVVGLELEKRSGVSAAKKHFVDYKQRQGHSTNTLVNAENSTGYFLSNVNNLKNCFYTHKAENCGYLMLSNDCSNFWRGFAEGAELGYQAGGYPRTYCAYNSYMDVGGSFNLYSAFLYNSCQHCFGSAGLLKKSYCILNMQYKKDDYFDLAQRIIEQMKTTGEWGRFFPPRIAPQYYEEAFCNDWLEPISLFEAARRGYRVGSKAAAEPIDSGTTGGIPDSIDETPADIIDRTFYCPVTGKPFKFQKKELAFHQRFNIPLSDIHWSKRIRDRIAEVFLIPGSE